MYEYSFHLSHLNISHTNTVFVLFAKNVTTNVHCTIILHSGRCYMNQINFVWFGPKRMGGLNKGPRDHLMYAFLCQIKISFGVKIP